MLSDAQPACGDDQMNPPDARVAPQQLKKAAGNQATTGPRDADDNAPFIFGINVGMENGIRQRC